MNMPHPVSQAYNRTNNYALFEIKDTHAGLYSIRKMRPMIISFSFSSPPYPSGPSFGLLGEIGLSAPYFRRRKRINEDRTH